MLNVDMPEIFKSRYDFSQIYTSPGYREKEIVPDKSTQWLEDCVAFVFEGLPHRIFSETHDDLDYITYELAKNAWMHGNLQDGSKPIAISTAVINNNYVLAIRDSGVGSKYLDGRTDSIGEGKGLLKCHNKLRARRGTLFCDKANHTFYVRLRM